MASLIVRVDLREDYEEDENSAEPVLLEHTSRLGTLDICSPQLELDAFMTKLEHADAAPRLHDIKVVNTDEDNLGEGGMWLPTNLFCRGEVIESRKTSTQLGLRLHLECCAFPWDSPWYTHLTHLRLVGINPMQRPTMEAFLAILVDSPNLETLTCLVIPPSAIIDASCTIPTHHDTEIIYQDLIPIFFEDSLLTCMTLLRIEAASWVNDWPSTLRVTESVRDHLDFSTVTTLHLNGMPNVHLPRKDNILHPSCSLWDTMGRNLPHLRTLHLHKSFPGGLLEFILTQAMLLIGVSHYLSCFRSPGCLSFRDPDGALTHAWSQLQRLELHQINLGESLDAFKPRSGDILGAFLWAWRQGGAPIQRLMIEESQCGFVHDLVHLWQSAAVGYDGKGLTVGCKANANEENNSLRSYSITIFS
ncbi:hypothetical protein MVEN_00980100 [Mycena venus]|uniref:Uncharacterized protein n=1 Tax=Mycena venus TaxID=2733690 RepID=A0A8H7CZY9_9AGAR|nr:hypothetical protein MVEN_00980100 [Mycena venus]